MYELFSPRARKVLQLANQEAQLFNHEYVGTEHILLGLVKEGGGKAASILKDFGVDLRKIRLEVEKLVKGGPEMVQMGRLPHTPRAKKVIEYSMEEARNLNHNYVGTEHILLGLLREQEGVAGLVLTNLGLNLEDVRKAVLSGMSETRTETDTLVVNCKKRCETCEWWKRFTLDCDEGHCHRFPPVLNPFTVSSKNGAAEDNGINDTGSMVPWFYPVTVEDDFCGEWTPRQQNPS